MVARILQLFNKEFTNLHQAAYLLGGFAFLSQLLGLVRDRLLAHFFGAGATLDVYYAAFRIPDFSFISRLLHLFPSRCLYRFSRNVLNMARTAGSREHAFS